MKNQGPVGSVYSLRGCIHTYTREQGWAQPCGQKRAGSAPRSAPPLFISKPSEHLKILGVLGDIFDDLDAPKIIQPLEEGLDRGTWTKGNTCQPREHIVLWNLLT